MIVADHWAEARQTVRKDGRQVTLRRFGWSDESRQAAEVHAEQRLYAAVEAFLQGDSRIRRREPKVPYNGAEGVPIREEIIRREGDAVITRNSYGALCLNTPDVLFADIDDHGEPPGAWALAFWLAGLAAAATLGFGHGSVLLFFVGAVLASVLAMPLATAVHKLANGLRGGPRALAWRRLEKFSAGHFDWHLRVYATPAGLRVLVMHRTFAPDSEPVQQLFKQLGVDPAYASMCRRQRCFRARLTAKPWRIGIPDPLRPRPGVWPVDEVHLPRRAAWVKRYEARAAGFAACRFERALGSATVNPQADRIRQLHDQLSRAETSQPLA